MGEEIYKCPNVEVRIVFGEATGTMNLGKKD